MVGVEGFEPSVSRSRTERSGLTELNPVVRLGGLEPPHFSLGGQTPHPAASANGAGGRIRTCGFLIPNQAD